MTLRAAIGLLLVLASWTSWAPFESTLRADPKPAPFAVGALRRDGIIIPFATFNGKRWENNWPSPRLELSVPIDLRAVPPGWWGMTPPPGVWDGWTAGKEPQPLTVTQPDWVPVHCQRQIGLKSSYRSTKPAPPPTEQPYPKDGFAVSPPQTVERIDLLAPSSTEAQALAPTILTAFNTAEREVESRYGHPISRRSREGVDPLIEAVYAYGDHPRFYYVESIRSYRRLGRRADECEALAFGTGWFVREQGKVRSMGSAVDLLRCDRYGANYMYPFGVIRLDGKLFWIAQFSGWDRESFVVLDVKPKGVESRVTAFGGGC